MALGLTESLQQSRLLVVAVDATRGQIRVKREDHGCSDLACADRTVVVAEEGRAAPLSALNPGDIVKVEDGPAGVPRVVVVRRVWDELTSPEW